MTTTGSTPSRAKSYWRLVRPFTLLAPAVGMVSAGVMALGASGEPTLHLAALLRLGAGALLAALLNATSNSVNQVYDLEADRINKPDRPLPSGSLTISQALVLAFAAGAGALVLAAVVGWQCFVVVVLGALAAAAYSVPPVRTKRHWLLSNLTIALARGLLMVVAGWATVGNVFTGARWWEAWLVGGVFGLFLLGAASTKDFGDMKGDEAAGCITLPIRFGVGRATVIMAPFFVVPFGRLVAFVHLGWIHADATATTVLGVVLTLWGGYVAYLIRRDPSAMSAENHPSWKHMYLMLMTFQVGLAVAYLL